MATDTATDEPCEECGSTEHATDGHFDARSPVLPAGHIDGARPDYATEPVHVDDDDDRR